MAALQQLQQAYDNYYGTIADYNRAQFRLFHALGYPAGVLACERTPGAVLPVDLTRPPQMAPVCAHCGCRILGHGVETGEAVYCCAHCARRSGHDELVDRGDT